ncbi:MAG: exo-beta-N-acetylmuramidase NamZ domain-containing protein, partial [candidate division WOR-3 bacterium]
MQLGIDLFLKGIKKYKYKKLAILTNHSSTSKNLIPSFKIISEKLNIKFILAPEHGLFGTKQMEEKIEDEYFNNIPVISLYGEK